MNYVLAGGPAANGVSTYDDVPKQIVAGNSVSHWQATGVGTPGYPTIFNRKPGCRADLSRLTGSSASVTAGWTVVDQATSITYSYTLQDPTLPDKWYLTSERDPRGNTVSYHYDGWYRVDKITDQSARHADFTWGGGRWDPLQKVVLTTAAGTRTWNLEYWYLQGQVPLLRNVIMPADGDGNHPSAHFEYYNSDDNISDAMDARGSSWHYHYHDYSNGLGQTVDQVYEPSVTPVGGYDYENVTVGGYDHGNPTYFAYCVSSQNGNSFTFNGTLYAVGNNSLTGFILDRRGNVWRHEYELGTDVSNTGSGAHLIQNEWMGSPIRKVYQPPVTDYLGGTNHVYFDTYAWDYDEGTLTSHTDAEGRVTSYTYDTTPLDNSGLANSMTTLVNGVSKTWRYLNWYLWNAQTSSYYSPRRVRTLDPDGHRAIVGMDWTYDEATSTVVDPKIDPYAQAQGQAYSFPSGLDLTTNRTYDPSSGDLKEEWMGSDAHTVYVYDAYGNPTSVTDPAGNAHTATFDAWGNKTSSSPGAPEGTTNFQYDSLDRLVETDLPGTAVLKQDYDLAGNPTIATKEDGVTHVTTKYDGLNRPTQVTQPVDASSANDLVTAFGYDLLGHRISTTNPRGKITTNAYDARGMARQVTYPDGNTRQSNYDGVGNRVRFTNGRGQTVKYLYDELNRLTGVDYPSSTDVGYEYRIDGPRTKMTDGTGTTNYAYDAAGRLLTQSSPLTGKTLTSHYIAGTNRRDTLMGGAQTWTYGYDAGLRLDHVDQTVGAASGARFEYYASGAVRYRHAGTMSRVWYDIDPRGRVRQIDHRAGPVASERTAQSAVYGYGPDGNMSAYIEWVADTNSYRHDYAHDRADRLTSEARAPLNGPGLSFSNGYEYDRQGNRTKVTRGGTAYAYGAPGLNDEFSTGEGFAFSSYDGDGNPGYVTGPNGLAMTFSYDEMGRVLQIAGTGASTFRYDGDGRRAERVAGSATTRFVYDGDQAVLETDGGNAVTTYRLPGAGFVSGGAQYYEQESLQGSVLSTRDAGAALKSHTQYDAYGVEYGAWESAPGALGGQRFAGQKGYQNDLATGMQLLGARYYLPVLGRFLTPDPIGHAGGLNLYAYCGDSPLLRFDPSGLDWLDNTANFFGGWGHSLSFGLTGRIAQGINRAMGNGEFQYGGAYFTAGEAAGVANQFAIGGAGGVRLAATRMAARAGVAEATSEVASVARGWASAVRQFLREPSSEWTYASRIRTRMIEGGAAHQFPFSFDEVIVRNGRVSYGTNRYIQWNHIGQMNGHSGTYEIGGQVLEGKFQITHRFFRPGR